MESERQKMLTLASLTAIIHIMMLSIVLCRRIQWENLFSEWHTMKLLNFLPRIFLSFNIKYIYFLHLCRDKTISLPPHTKGKIDDFSCLFSLCARPNVEHFNFYRASWFLARSFAFFSLSFFGSDWKSSRKWNEIYNCLESWEKESSYVDLRKSHWLLPSSHPHISNFRYTWKTNDGRMSIKHTVRARSVITSGNLTCKKRLNGMTLISWNFDLFAVCAATTTRVILRLEIVIFDFLFKVNSLPLWFNLSSSRWM